MLHPIVPPADLRSSDDPLEAAFHALDAAPDDVSAKVAVARLLKRADTAPAPEYAPWVHALLAEPDVDPGPSGALAERSCSRRPWSPSATSRSR